MKERVRTYFRFDSELGKSNKREMNIKHLLNRKLMIFQL